MSFAVRLYGQAAGWTWLLWLAGCAWLTADPFRAQLDRFADGGPAFFRLILVALAAAPLALWLYHVTRNRGLWRHEPALISAALLVVFGVHQPGALLVWLAVATTAYGVGRLTRERLGLDDVTGPEDLVLSTTIGLGLLSCLLYALGLLGWLHPATLAAVLIAAAVAFQRSIRALPATLAGLARAWAATPGLRSGLPTIAVAFGVVQTLLCVMVTIAPAVTHDPLALHLAPARWYSEQGALDPMPYLDYSYYPQGFEALLAMVYSLAGQPAAQMAAPLFFGLTLLLLFAVARRCGFDRSSAAVGVAFAAAIPYLHWTGSNAKNDLAVALFQLGALYCGLRARHAPASPHWLRLGAFLLGMSFAVKHVALFGALPIGLLYVWIWWKRRLGPSVAAGAAVIFLAVSLLWPARTLVLTGNPVYPMTLSRAVEVSPAPFKRVNLANLAWVAHFRGREMIEVRTDHPLGVALVLLAPLWLLLRRVSRTEDRTTERACLFYVGAACLYWGSTWPMLRYGLPPVALLVTLTAARVPSWTGPARSWLALPATAYALLFGVLCTAVIEVHRPHAELLIGRINREQFLARSLETWPSMERLRAYAEPGDFVLAYNNCSRLYAPDVGRFHCVMASDADDGAASLRRTLPRNPYRFLLLPSGDHGREMLHRLELEGPPPEPIHADERYTLYRLGKPALARRADHERHL